MASSESTTISLVFREIITVYIVCTSKYSQLTGYDTYFKEQQQHSLYFLQRKKELYHMC